MIRFLHRWEIDDEKWNRSIAASAYETVYAFTWYLDACSEYWGGLVSPDYECVMPVAFRKKFGIKYIYQPRFCQQLGVYSEKPVDGDILRDFLLAAKKKFGLGDYALNEGNRLTEGRGFNLSDNTNYTLQLLKSHEELSKGYSSNCRRNVRKALQSGLEFSADISIEELVELKRQHDHIKQSEEHYRLLTSMFSVLKDHGHVKAFGVKLEENPCAGAIFVFCNKRMHYLLSASNEEGKERSAMFLVIDRVIQEYEGKNMVLDFEGSNMANIARFFTGFGAMAQSYQRISFDNVVGKIVQKIRDVRSD
jgi:hypothetical protein